LEPATINLSGQAENNMVVKFLTAVKTVAPSPKLLGVVLGLFVVWFVFMKLEVWTVAFVDMGVGLRDTVTQGWVDTIEEAFKPFSSMYHRTVNIDGARRALKHITISTVGKDILCTSSVSMTLGLASWLNVSCKSSLEDEKVYKTTRDTTNELGHWAGISEVLNPYVNHFHQARIPLLEKQAQLKHNKAQVPAKQELLGHLDNYIKGLDESADCMFDITLGTEGLSTLLFHNLKEVHRRVHAITFGTKNSWWPQIYRQDYHNIDQILSRLLDVIDVQIAKLNLSPCIDELIKTTIAATKSIRYATDCENAVMRMIKEHSAWLGSPDKSLIQLKPILTGFLQQPTGVIVEELVYASRRLEGHKQDLKDANSVLYIAYDLSTTNDLTQLLEVLDDCLSGLSTVRGRVRFARARDEEEYKRKWQ
jgi:hypothetical protein